MIAPLPKFVSFIAIVATVFSALNVASVLHVMPPNVAALVTFIAVVASSLSHSLGGTGGK